MCDEGGKCWRSLEKFFLGAKSCRVNLWCTGLWISRENGCENCLKVSAKSLLVQKMPRVIASLWIVSLHNAVTWRLYLVVPYDAIRNVLPIFSTKDDFLSPLWTDVGVFKFYKGERIVVEHTQQSYTMSCSHAPKGEEEGPLADAHSTAPFSRYENGVASCRSLLKREIREAAGTRWAKAQWQLMTSKGSKFFD